MNFDDIQDPPRHYYRVNGELREGVTGALTSDNAITTYLEPPPTGPLESRLGAMAEPHRLFLAALATWAGVCPQCMGSRNEAAQHGVVTCSSCKGRGLR